jgi:predicted nucleic acid-binding protein
MKKCYLDSNILVYWNNVLAPEHNSTVNLLARLRDEDSHFFVSPLVLDEFLHAVLLRTRLNNKKDPYSLLKSALDDLLDLPGLEVINPPTDIDSQKKVIGFVRKYLLRPRDAYHLLIMIANDINSFATNDNDFEKVFATKVLEKA